MNKIIKIFFCIIIIALLTIMLSQVALAVNFDIKEKFDGKTDQSKATKKVARIISTTINLVQIVSAGIAIIMLIALAIKYLSSSVEGKADIKKSSTIYIVGAIIIFAAIGILQIIKTFAQTNINGQFSE